MELTDITTILSDKCRPKDQSAIFDKARIMHTIQNKAINYLLYKFDGEGKVDLFPFFANSTKKLRAMCDYFLFAQIENTIYALLIELKDGVKSQGATIQLQAGECFWNFIRESASRLQYDTSNLVTIKVNFRPKQGMSNIAPKYENEIVSYYFTTFAINQVIKCFNDK